MVISLAFSFFIKFDEADKIPTVLDSDLPRGF
jgi:hypothetical protein